MKTTKRTIDGTLVLGETFNSPQELLSVLGQRPHVFDQDFYPDDYVCNDPSFYGWTKSKQVKADFLNAKCDPSVLKAIDGEQPTSARKTEFYHDVVGFKPIVPLALMGQPKAMANQRTVLVKRKVINMHVSIGAHCGYSIAELSEAGKTIIEYIIGLEQQGYRVNLTVYFATYWGDVAYLGLRVKSASQPLDISRCAYPFVNPTFLRGIGFMWYQRTDGFEHSYGYGQPIGRKTGSAMRAFEESLPRENKIVLYLADIIKGGKEELDKALSELKARQFNSL